MIVWTPWERRWRDALFGALIPPHAKGPGLGALDLTAFWNELTFVAPPLLRLGLRVAVWMLTLSPLLLLGRVSLFPGLSDDEKDALLTRADSSRLFLLRQLVAVLKVVAGFAYFSDPRVRASLDEVT